MGEVRLVIVTVNDGVAPAALALRDRLVRAWPQPAPASITVETLASSELDQLARADIVVFVDAGAAPPPLLGLLTTLEEASVPVVALTDGPPPPRSPYSFAGALVERLDLADAELAALLRGILHRQHEVKRLRQETTLAQRFQAGMRNQITRMHEEMHLAAIVQREFLPQQIPSLHGVTFGALWRPAHYVSGDIYDIARLDEDHIGVLLADAAGHGVPAALMTMVIHRSLVTKQIKGTEYRLLPPGEVMARLNNGLIHRQGGNGRFATAVYALINCRTRHMAIAGAGHPASKLIRADGATAEIESAGSLLGIFEDETFEQVELTLNVGDRMMIYSDGFEQAFPEDAADHLARRRPTDRYHAEFDALARLTDPASMIREIERRLDDEAGSLHQVDDLTLICLQSGPLPQQAPTDPQPAETDERFSVTM